ncbi:hypothetical protein BpHYR1_033418 [Brachionus plicatilis]|uniref:Uncharacterized protein n=1 Tax=Brachionus plicatilis TaxID=10195 RepID=A0A3M7R9B9_BRAPC|nr:hypothetical protein BpHYR1_033418 [Brachionus plicatilis]
MSGPVAASLSSLLKAKINLFIKKGLLENRLSGRPNDCQPKSKANKNSCGAALSNKGIRLNFSFWFQKDNQKEINKI